jgi:hypothetical protein
MKMKPQTKRITFSVAAAILAGAALACALAPQASAQSCAMCYQNAAASAPQARVALQHGILILMVPTLSLFLGIFALIYSRRNLAR